MKNVNKCYFGGAENDGILYFQFEGGKMRKNQSSMASAVTLLTALRMFTSGES